MAYTDEETTLVCLFHHRDQAQAVVGDLTRAGIQENAILLVDDERSLDDGPGASVLEGLGIPDRDRQHLREGVAEGGAIVCVAASQDQIEVVENIFGSHRATKIDESEAGSSTGAERGQSVGGGMTSGQPGAGMTVLPVVEEEIAVGKRSVDRGGVRVYQRVVEIPAEESVLLQEKHVKVDRRPVDREVNETDLALNGEQTIELVETAEEAVVYKRMRVVEEIHVSKDTLDRTEHIRDMVRRTEVEVERFGGRSERDLALTQR